MGKHDDRIGMDEAGQHPPAPSHDPAAKAAADPQAAEKQEWPKWVKDKATGDKFIVQSEDEFNAVNKHRPLIQVSEESDAEKAAKADAKK